MNYINLVTLVRLLAKRLDFSVERLYELICDLQVNLVKQYNLSFSTNKSEPLVASETRLSIQQYRSENGSLSYDALCQFIGEQAFDPGEQYKDRGFKLFQIYDELNHAEKEQFMRNYMNFNKQKQELIESHSQNIYKCTSVQRQVDTFTRLHGQWMKKWHLALVAAIEDLLKSDHYMRKYGFIVKYISSKALASMCLSYMMSATIPAVHEKVISIAQRMCHGLYSELRKLSVFSAYFPLQDQIRKDGMLLFFCEMINLVVNKCEAPDRSLFVNIPIEDDDFNGKLFCHFRASDPNGNSRFRLYGVLKIHPYVAENFKSYHDLLHSGSYLLPMVHPPKEWKLPTEGGYLSIALPLVKSVQPESFDIIMAMAHKTGQMKSIYDSLNALGLTMWAINQFNFEVFQSECRNLKSNSGTTELLLKKKSRKLDQISKDKNNLELYYGLIFALAQSFNKNGEAFYLPHNLDFRGRVYPHVSFLSHHSEDLVRSLMMFWESKELGPEGFDWLQYQLSSLYNKTKFDMKDLKCFVDANRENIIDSAKNPLTGKMWWTSADSPWQTLALCKEIASVWEFPGDIAKFKSRIPVHQDGTCNGLQHYAALSSDKKAADSVNVLPSEKRQDVYLTILSLVKSHVLKDQATSSEFSELAALVYPILERRLIKQTVMTTVYGVTLYGATRQIKNQIDDILATSPETKKTEQLRNIASSAASYIARQVLHSINELFSGAQLIQNWLVYNCTRCIQAFSANQKHIADRDFFTKSHFQPFMWTSLSGFPVVQYYRKNTPKNILTSLQTVSVMDFTKLSPIDERKLRNGIAPNFIHSIDAIHLLMTSLASKEKQITFASVHDCFWTHASEVPVLSSIIREEFVRLHKSNIMQNIYEDLLHVHQNNYQLVWVCKTEHREFCDLLSELRKSDLVGHFSVNKKWNSILSHELNCPISVQTLIAKFNPELLFKDSHLKDPIIYNSSFNVARKKVKITKSSHVPVLVPVRILELPNLGSLDIDLVRDSVYFFS
ncbi:DNA/RNA polymerase [Metschnikowia bicuspidata]|uniref:DNA-directed RNA polymerase n=1 Tax=Metschnikowia bicuspidata TaxID=27322 RepID=A0A4P9ZEL1_9ASCO|nr:DNA/RNA polymerase [Metschnikowia bicuspidata]